MADEKNRLHKSIDLSHHLSDLAKRRVASPIKSLQGFYKPGNIEFGGGKLIDYVTDIDRSLEPPKVSLNESRAGPQCGVREATITSFPRAYFHSGWGIDVNFGL